MIATVALTVIGWLTGPRVRPLQPSAEVPRFSDVLKHPTPVVERPPASEDSLWSRIFFRVVFYFAEPQANALIFGPNVQMIDGSLIHRSTRSGVRAEPFLARLERWTKERCRVLDRRIAAANINQFVLDRRIEVKYVPVPSDLPTDPKDTSSPVWRGPAGEQMREAVVELARDGRILLDDFGDIPFDEVVEILQPIPSPPDTCPKGRRS